MDDTPQRAAANVTAAFGLLLDALASALHAVNEAGAAAFARGDYPAVERLRAAAVEQQRLAEAVRSLREGWVAAHPAPPAPGLLPNEDAAVPQVLGRVAPRGERTPEVEFYVPMLRALVEMGGSARPIRVIRRVGEMMRERLKPIDLERLRSRPTPRWQSAVRWARQSMVNEGLLLDTSPAGIWEISPAGREYLAQHGG